MIDYCPSCGFYEDDLGCFCPDYDKWFACPFESQKPENIEALKEYADWDENKFYLREGNNL